MYPEIKRLFDFLFSIFAILILSPLFIIIIVYIFIFNGKNIFFIQERPGKKEEIFSLIKFQTMNNKKDKNGNLLPDSLRITKSGKIIRKLSLDEIPQFFNILKGEMSLIGPRPLLIQYLPYYTNEEKKRHNVRPGITGWAQVNGRNSVEWDKRLSMDIYYVNNLSFILDIKIFFKTIRDVIYRKNIIVVPSEKLKPLNYYRDKI